MRILKPTLENLAQRVAASNGGRITPNDLAPYLPVSLSIIERCLDEMTDGTVVLSSRRDGLKTYEFTELLDAAPREMPSNGCLYCGDEAGDDTLLLCYSCNDELCRELLKLAESTAWPSEAVWQHELLFITSTAHGPIRIADVAGNSRLTLKQVKARLAELAADGYARQSLDAERGVVHYEFPRIRYRRKAFQRHDAFIRMHPSSLKDELEVKLIKSLVAALLVILGCFLLSAGAHIPPVLLLLGGAAVLAIVVWFVFTKTTEVEPERIDGEP